MRITTLVCVCAVALIAAETGLAFGALAQDPTTGMSGGPPTDAKPNVVPPPASEKDPAARSAKSIECTQKADAQGLQGKPRKRFLHECRSGL
jgi:hypothetical protein